MNEKKIRILFNVWASAKNVNAQSLNAREIALRLDPQRFESTFFFARQAERRLLNRKTIRLIKMPPRLGSLVMASHLIWGNYDILFYPPHDRIRRWYRALVRIGKPKKIIESVEGTAQQILSIPSPKLEHYRQCLFEADACYAISQHIAMTMQQEFALSMEVVPIGVDTTSFAFVDRASHRPPLKILYVGSLQPRKQLHLILDLAQQISSSTVEFHIIGDVIGSPTYRDQLLKRKSEEQLEHVHFHGPLVQTEVRKWMQQSDLLLLPSRLEGTPKVTFEAAATGLPSLVFDDYRTATVIDGVTGFQVKTFEQMQERLNLLLENRTLRLQMGVAATEHIKQFDWDVVVKEWERVFFEVVGAAGHG
jgi:glycosyltransferase involved in cell wall biosynthesis